MSNWPSAMQGSMELMPGDPSRRSVPSSATCAEFSRAMPSRASSGAPSSTSRQLSNAGTPAISATLPPAWPGAMGHKALLLRVLIAETGPVTERLRVREIDDDEGRWLVRIVRRGSGSVVTWRRAQMVLLSAQGMDVSGIAEVAFTSEDRVHDVIRNFSADGFTSLYPRYKGGPPPRFTLAQRREIKKVAKSRPAEHDLPFSAWSLSKLAEFLVAEGGSTTSATRACGCYSARRASVFNA
jgi:transposase